MTATDVAFVGGDATNVIGILSCKVAVEIVQRLSHFGGVLLIDTEDDCLSEAIRFLHEIGEMSHDRFGAFP